MSTLLWNETNITIQNVTFNIYGGSVLPTLQIVMAQRNNMAAKTVQVSNISIDVVGVVVTAPNFLQLPLLRLLLNETVPTTFKREAASLTIFENISVNVSGSTLNFVGPQAALLDITCAKCAHIYVNISNCSITVQTASPHFVEFKSTQKLQDITLAMTGVNAPMNVTPCNSTWAVDGQPCRVAGITSFAADYIARTSSFFLSDLHGLHEHLTEIIVVVEQGSLTMVFLGSAALNVSTSASIVIIQSARLYFNAKESSFDFQEIGIHVSHIVARLNAGCNGALVWLGGNGYDANPGRMQAIVVYVTNVSATISLFECSSFFRTAATIQLLVSYLRSATLTVIDICLQTRMLCMQRMPPLNSSTSTLFPSLTPALLSYFVAITAILADNASNMSLAVTSAFLNSTIANFVITMYQSEGLSSNLVEESAVIVSFRSVEAVASQLFIVIADTVVDATTSLDSPVVTTSNFVASSITGILHALLICSLTDVRIVTVSISNSEIQSHFSLVVVNDAHLRVLASFSINVNPAVMVYDFLGADPVLENLFSSLFAAISTGVNIMRDSSQAIRNCSLATSRNSIDTSEAASIIRVYASLLMPPTNSTNCSYIVSNSTAPVSPESSMRIKLSIFGVLCYPSCFFNISSITLQRLFGVLSPSILYVLTEDQSSSDRLMLDASSVHFLGLTVDGDSSGGSVWNRTAFLVGNPSIQLDGSSLLKFNRLFGQSPFSIATTHPKKPPTIDLGCNRISSDSLTSLSPSFRTLTSRMLLKEFGSQSRVVNVAYPDPPFTSRFFLPDDNFTCRLDPLSESIGETHTLSMDLPFTDIIDPYRRIDVATTTLTSINVVVSFVMFIGAPDSIATVADAQLFMMLSQSSCAPASLKESTSTAKSLMISPFSVISFVFDMSTLLWNETNITIQNVTFNIYG
ncbi:Hypothetical protein, putative [Bodo saltans]|uniref:Uncharacterized protein n=1 Tax=Bodo saltans TaxID=75058 RepID=A0A0S4ITV2_BODSA|nr:Hypothetical protein, putative [Bodo saltans]|eukprot:CUF56239.1 Hypothetical protein, putative [Bodo saltans]